MRSRYLPTLFILIWMIIGSASASAQGESDSARLCQHGGFAQFVRVDGSGFMNAGECTSYAARDGTLLPIGPPTVTVQSVSYLTENDNIIVNFVASRFALNAELVDYIVTVPALGITADYADVFPSTFYTDATGTFSQGFTLAGFGCIEGTLGSITIADSTGRSATGVFYVICTESS